MVADFLPPLNSIVASLTAGLAGISVYLFLKTRSERGMSRDEAVVLHVEIPNDAAAALVGRAAAKITAIEASSGASVSFIDPGGPLKLCVIRGTASAVLVAKESILQSVREHAQVKTEEISASQKLIDYLAANENAKLREVCGGSGARIYIDRAAGRPASLLVRGSHDQIEAARELLKKSAAQVELGREELHRSLAGRSSRGSVVASSTSLSQSLAAGESLVATGCDGFAEVFVSAVRTPHDFHVQLVGARSIELDRLVDAMSDHYAQPSFAPPTTLEVGALVAAPFTHDACWYRARIAALPTDDTALPPTAQVEFVDFGDRASVPVDQLKKLRPDFLTLRFQAIQCRLAGVEPIGSGRWEESAVESFESLTYCSQWKSLMARVESYWRSGDALLPCVTLVDTNTPQDLDVATELISKGLAVAVSKSH